MLIKGEQARGGGWLVRAQRVLDEGAGECAERGLLDLNPGMIAVARAVTPPELHIEWVQASAEQVPSPDRSFDVVLCQLGLQFVTDKQAALRELRRVLADGGRIALNLPGPTPEIFTVIAGALARHAKPEMAGFVELVFSLHDAARIRGLLEQAGFRDVAIRQDTRRLPLPEPAHFLWQYVASTPLSAGMAEVDDAARDAIEREVVAGCQPFLLDGVLTLDLPMTVATAHS